MLAVTPVKTLVLAQTFGAGVRVCCGVGVRNRDIFRARNVAREGCG